MARIVSPRKKMSLRTTIKPPKPFGGDVRDDVSSSILGDRTLDSSELEETSGTAPPIAPASRQSMSLQQGPVDNTRPKQSTSKKVPRVRKDAALKKPWFKKEASGSMTREPTSLSKQWRPGLEMTPAINKKYLGSQIEYKDNLPPAAFPTLDTDELAKAWEQGQAPYDALKPSAQNGHATKAPNKPTMSARMSDESISRQRDAKDASFAQRIQTEIAASSVTGSLGKSSDARTDIEDREATEIWEELSIYYRLEIMDSFMAAFDPPPSAHRIFSRLQLTEPQVVVMVKILRDRQHRNESENRDLARLVHGASGHLMNSNISVSQDRLSFMLDRTIYTNTDRDDHLITNSNDLQNARLLLFKVGLSPQILYNAIPPLVPFQQRIGERRKRREAQPQQSSQPNRAIVPPSTYHTAPTSRLHVGEHASIFHTQNGAAQETAVRTSQDQRSPPPARGTARTWETNVPPPRYPQTASIRSSPSSLGTVTPLKRRSVNSVSPSLAEQRKHRDRIVDAAVKCDPEVRAGTALTGGGGTRGLDRNDAFAEPKPMGDLGFEDWVEEMDYRYQNGERTINRNPREFLRSIAVMETMIKGHGFFF